MKFSLLQRFFSGVMALLVLTTSVGLTVQSHTCYRSGQSTAAIIFSAPEHKCSPITKEPTDTHTLPGKLQIKQGCCEFGAHLHKLEAASHQLDHTKHLVSAVALAWISTSVGYTYTPAAQLAPAALWYASNSSPPPRAGRALLTFACTWRV